MLAPVWLEAAYTSEEDSGQLPAPRQKVLGNLQNVPCAQKYMLHAGPALPFRAVATRHQPLREPSQTYLAGPPAGSKNEPAVICCFCC